MESGIYKITCRERVYIGSAKVTRSRIREHLLALQKGTHYNVKMQRSWNKYGEQEFKFVVIFRCPEDQLLKYEQHFIDKYRAWDHDTGFNMTLFVSRSGLTKEGLAKLQQDSRARNADPEFRSKQLEHLHRVHSNPESRRRHSATMKRIWADNRDIMMAQLAKGRKPKQVKVLLTEAQRFEASSAGQLRYWAIAAPEQKAARVQKRLETMRRLGIKTRVKRKDKS